MKWTKIGRKKYPTENRFVRVTMFSKSPRWTLFLFWVFLFMFALGPASSLAGGLPAVGTYLPKFKLETPPSENEKIYLGVEDLNTFSISQINCQLVLVEIIGIYCPQCHTQAPLFNKLFYRIKKRSEMSENIKMLAVAGGATSMEVAYLKKNFRIPYPIVKDYEYDIHKLLGEPLTPFTMLVTRDEKVVFAHLGVIEDIDKFFLHIKKLIQLEQTQ